MYSIAVPCTTDMITKSPSPSKMILTDRWWWCLLAALGTEPPPIMTISSESSTADAIRLNVFVRSFTLICKNEV